MKTALTIIAVTLALAGCAETQMRPSMQAESAKSESASTPKPRNLIITYQGTDQTVVDAATRYDAEIIYRLNNLKMVVVHIKEGRSIEEAIRYFRQIDGVIGVEQDQINSLH